MHLKTGEKTEHGGILHKPWEEASQEGSGQQGQRLSRGQEGLELQN